jgi:hypothetical protein
LRLHQTLIPARPAGGFSREEKNFFGEKAETAGVIDGYQAHRQQELKDTQMLDPTTAADAMDAMSTLTTGISINTDGDPASVAILGVLIPIIAIVLGIGIGMLSLYLDYRKKREFFELHHKERMAAIEKGIEVPPLPPEFFQDPRRRVRTPGDYLRRGLVWLLVGGAITLALQGSGEKSHSLWGLIPAAVGLANLIYYFVEGKTRGPRDSDSADSRKPDRPV